MQPPSDNQKIAIVTGSSRGIGYEASLALARSGFMTYATIRNLEKQDAIRTAATKENLLIRVVQLDVTSENSIKKAIEAIISEVGRIDLLVNNAGYGLTGAFEDLAMDEIKAQYETNFFGLIMVTQAVLPTMRKQGSGRIINISSGAGRFGYPGGSAYVSTKFALEGLSESMAYKLEQFGIKVVLIKPGVIRTNFEAVIARKSNDPSSPYSDMMKMMSSRMGEFFEKDSDPDLVAKVIVEAATSSNPKLRYLAGKDVEQWIAARNTMSDEQFRTMMMQGRNEH